MDHFQGFEPGNHDRNFILKPMTQSISLNMSFFNLILMNVLLKPRKDKNKKSDYAWHDIARCPTKIYFVFFFKIIKEFFCYKWNNINSSLVFWFVLFLEFLKTFEMRNFFSLNLGGKRDVLEELNEWWLVYFWGGRVRENWDPKNC